MNIERYKRGIYRFYNIEDVGILPSVTTVLGMLPKPSITLWAVFNVLKFLKKKIDISKVSTYEVFNFHKKLLLATSNEGTSIHNLIEDYAIRGKDSDHNAVVRYKKFEKETGFICEKAELTVWDSEEYKTAGSLDLFGKCNNIIPIVWDLKTSKEIRLSHKIQAVIYKDMYCKLNGLDINEVKSGILLISRDKVRVYKTHINTQEEEIKYRKIFKLLSTLFHTLLENEWLDLSDC